MCPSGPTCTMSHGVYRCALVALCAGFNWESHKRHPWYNTVGHKIPDLQVCTLTVRAAPAASLVTGVCKCILVLYGGDTSLA
jgi:hypothetical protein